MTAQLRRAEVPANLAGKRLDQALAAMFPGATRSQLQHWIEAGLVRLNGAAARKRDKYHCQHCGATQTKIKRALDVHHIRPFREFGYVPGKNESYKQANDLINLISLCKVCHKQAESGKIAIQPYLL